MKRFVTYLYECRRGNKSKNVGFIRVNVKGEETKIEIYIRNLVRDTDEGTIFVLVDKERLQGIKMGEIGIENGQCDWQIRVQTSDICESGFCLQEIEGIGICFDSGFYIASCWKDECAEGIIREEFYKQDKGTDGDLKKEERGVLVVAQENKKIDSNIINEDPYKSYEKIDLSQIRDLPSPNWHLTTNSFLIHGFWNYGYLVLKKNVVEGQKTLALGVPGIYERPEAVMAVLFGFPNFEVLSQELVDIEKEKNQEVKEGMFGCWFVELKM